MQNEFSTLTVREFCERFHVSRSTLYRLTRAGSGPRVLRVGRRTLITADAARDWIKEAERRAPASHDLKEVTRHGL